jgi:hypothetical protein
LGGKSHQTTFALLMVVAPLQLRPSRQRNSLLTGEGFLAIIANSTWPGPVG